MMIMIKGLTFEKNFWQWLKRITAFLIKLFEQMKQFSNSMNTSTGITQFTGRPKILESILKETSTYLVVSVFG
jgi:hypothetical protein